MTSLSSLKSIIVVLHGALTFDNLLNLLTSVLESLTLRLPPQCNMIGCSCVSEDKRWLVTADHGGDDSMIIVWDRSSMPPTSLTLTLTLTLAFSPLTLTLAFHSSF